MIPLLKLNAILRITAYKIPEHEKSVKKARSKFWWNSKKSANKNVKKAKKKDLRT